MDRDYIAPGDSLPLEVIFYTSRYSSRVYKAPAIYTNEDTTTTIIRWVRLYATVCPEIDTIHPVYPDPSILSFFYAAGSTYDSAEVKFHNTTDTAVSFELVDEPLTPMIFDFPPTIAANDSVTGYIRIDSDTPVSPFKQSFTVEFSDSASTRLTIPVRCSNFVGTGGDVGMAPCIGE